MIFPEENKKRKDWCRLHVLFASDAHKAVIFRRGPSKWTQQILWDVDTDQLIYGQWIKGSLHEEWCDLSPSGKYLIYFVAKYYLKKPTFDVRGYATFTAISEAPNFTAITLWPLGDSWEGGGYFIDNDTTIFLRHKKFQPREVDPSHPNKLFTIIEDFSKPFSWTIVPSEVQQREGWNLIQKAEPKDKLGFYNIPEILERKDPKQKYSLIAKKLGYISSTEAPTYGGPVIKEFYLKNLLDNTETLLPDVSFANFDQRGRLIMARYGQLLICDLSREPLEARVLVDLNDQKPPTFKNKLNIVDRLRNFLKI